ncbi:Hypothetical predicted protein [Paramuricea clavata]|uniref:Uncharacterized protein n=1 Tax=Paramuricea clavata TaxID=317549 RepID=A0A6S7JLW7_PARCT|nr:Hypothetical predicted protein [Paramuricea clavata]
MRSCQLYKDALSLPWERHHPLPLSARYCLWLVNKDITQLDTILKFNTNDGFDLNVKKYQEIPSRPVAIDVERAKSTMFKLSSLEEKLGAIKHRLQERNNELYDCNHVPKQWAGDEISYIAQHLEKLEKLNKNLICLHSSITNTWQLSSARFNKDTVSGEERKGITRRRKEQRRIARQKQTNMGKKQAYKLILKIHGKEFADAFLIKGNTQKVSTQKLGSTVDDMEEAKRLLDILLARRAAAKKATTVKSQEERTSLESESELSDGSEVDDEITEPGDDESDSFEMDEDSDY